MQICVLDNSDYQNLKSLNLPTNENTYDLRPFPYMPIMCSSNALLDDLPNVIMSAVSSTMEGNLLLVEEKNPHTFLLKCTFNSDAPRRASILTRTVSSFLDKQIM